MADANMRIVITAIDNASKELNKVKSALNGMSSTASNASDQTEDLGNTSKAAFSKIGGYIAAVTAAVYAMKKAWDFAEQGAQLLSLEAASSKVAAGMGGDMQNIVLSIQKASLGTISYYDAMQSASNAMMLGLGTDADKLANLMEIAALRGRAMGLTTTQAFSDIVRGIGRMSPLILDNLGIVIDAESRYGIYAESIGKTAAQLTAAEKRQALFNGVLEEGNRLLAESGGLSADYATGMARATTAWKDYWNTVKTQAGASAGSFFLSESERKQIFEEERKAIFESSTTYEEYRFSIKNATSTLRLYDAETHNVIQSMSREAFIQAKTAQARHEATTALQNEATALSALAAAENSTNISLTASQLTIADSINTYGTFNNLLEQAWKKSDLLSQAINGMPSYHKILIEIETRVMGMTADAARWTGQYYDWYSNNGDSQGGSGVPLGAGEIPTTPGRASGGPVRGGVPYIVGEQGPELFVPPANGNIIPNDRMGNGGKTVSININYSPAISTASESELQWKLKPIIEKALKEM